MTEKEGHCFTFQMATTARAVAGQTQEPRAPSGFPLSVVEAQAPGRLLLPSQVHSQGAGWEMEQPGFELVLQNGMLVF